MANIWSFGSSIVVAVISGIAGYSISKVELGHQRAILESENLSRKQHFFVERCKEIKEIHYRMNVEFQAKSDTSKSIKERNQHLANLRVDKQQAFSYLSESSYQILDYERERIKNIPDDEKNIAADSIAVMAALGNELRGCNTKEAFPIK